jgi:hypothetical protein
MIRFLRALRLQRNESLRVVPQQLLAFVTPTSTRRVLAVVKALWPVIDKLTDWSEPAGDFADLPEKFHPLVPLMRVWSISDDADRSARLSRTSSESLSRLAEKVRPHFGPINRYLHRLGATWPESAAALARLAECATEANLLPAMREWRRQQRA